MGLNTGTVKVKLDILKLALAIFIVFLGITGFYVFAEQSVILRVIGLLVCVVVSIYVALQTDKGRDIWDFFQDAQIEVRKVVWPTRQETTQTTMIVVLVVIIVSIILWLLDMFLGWSVRSIMGQGG